MNKQIIVLAVSSIVASQVACGAPTPIEVHQRVFNHLKAVRDALVPAPAIRFVETFPPIAVPRAHILHLAQADVEPFEVPAPPPNVPGEPVDPAGIANWAEGFALSTTQGVLDQLFPRGGGARRPIIVGGDSKNIPTLSEDLTVMMRILEKAAGAKAEGPATASGIALFSFGQPSSPRAFYLDGYGAMFVLQVKFPLVAPPKNVETNSTETNSEWEKAKEEIYGRRAPFDELKLKAAQGEEFDANKVDALQTQIISDLANAKNIRGLKSDDSVTVVVLGGGARIAGARGLAARPPRTGGTRGATGRGGTQTMEMAVGVAEAGAQSTMTVRAKKADIDGFAKGKFDLEEFRKKVLVQVY